MKEPEAFEAIEAERKEFSARSGWWRSSELAGLPKASICDSDGDLRQVDDLLHELGKRLKGGGGMTERERLDSAAGWFDAVAAEAEGIDRHIRDALQARKPNYAEVEESARLSVRRIRHYLEKIEDHLKRSDQTEKHGVEVKPA